MIFRLDTSKSFYCDDEKDKLEPLGFSFEFVKNEYLSGGDWYKNNTVHTEPTVEINSLDELIEFSKKYGQLIICADDNSIEIYDGYRE